MQKRPEHRIAYAPILLAYSIGCRPPDAPEMLNHLYKLNKAFEDQFIPPKVAV